MAEAPLNPTSLTKKPISEITSDEELNTVMENAKRHDNKELWWECLLWMLKIACGVYFSIASKERVRLSETHTINMSRVRRAFFESKWDSRAGLYFSGSAGTKIIVDNSLGLAPLSSDSDLLFSGVRISLHGFVLEFLFDTTNVNPGPWPGLVRRPTELLLRRKLRHHSIILTWPPGQPEASVVMEERA